MVSMAVKQQIHMDQVHRIAALILNEMYGSSDYTSGRLIANCHKELVVPKGTDPKEAAALHKQQRQCRNAIRAANQIRLYMTGQIE